MKPGQRPKHHTAFILVAVLIVVAIGALVAASVLANTRVVTQRVRLLEDGAESRLLVSAAQHACQRLLLEQRDALLRGNPADLPERIVLFEHAGERAVARLIAVRGQILRPTAARLDVNAVTEEQLRGLEEAGIDPRVIDTILALRDDRPILSLDDLIDDETITPELVHGDVDAMQQAFAADSNASPTTTPQPNEILDAGMPGGIGAPGDVALADLLTVYAADPSVQIGIDPERADAFGRNRINLNREFSDDLADAIRGEFDDNVVNVVRGLIVGQGVRFTDDGVIARTLTQFGVDAENWGPIFDAFATSPDPYLRNRIDVNAASPEVIAALPGLPPDAGDLITAFRDSVDDERRASPTWIAADGLVTAEEYAAVATLITSRSLQFEIVIETGFEPIDDQRLATPMRLDGTPIDEPRLQARRVTELTIDLAAPRPRIAAIRDVTHRPLAMGLWNAAREAAEQTPTVDRMSMDEWLPDFADPSQPPEPAQPAMLNPPDSFFDPPASPESPPDGGGGPFSGAEGGGGSADAVDRRAGRWRAGPASGRASRTDDGPGDGE